MIITANEAKRVADIKVTLGDINAITAKYLEQRLFPRIIEAANTGKYSIKTVFPKALCAITLIEQLGNLGYRVKHESNCITIYWG